MCIYVVSHISMTSVYNLFDCDTLSGMTISENMARKHMYLKWMISWQLQYEMEHKGVFVDYLLYDRHYTNCSTFHFYVEGPIQRYSFGRGWRKAGKRLKWLHLQPSGWSSSTSVKKVGILLMFLVQSFPLACLLCLSRISLLGYFLIIYFIFILLELLPLAFFDFDNAYCHSVVSHILLADVMF